MSVRGKFFIKTCSAHAVGNGSVELAAATRGSENKQWAAASPSGSISLAINNKPAWDFFMDNVGREVYVDFTLAADPDAPHPFEEETTENHYNRGRCVRCSGNEDAEQHQEAKV